MSMACRRTIIEAVGQLQCNSYKNKELAFQTSEKT